MRHGFSAVIEEYARCCSQRLPVLFGLAVIENQLDETAELHLLGRDEMLAREPALLRRARELMPALPFSRLDCLVVDEMGKDISGSGMDTNVIGRKPARRRRGRGPGDHADLRPRPHGGERGQRHRHRRWPTSPRRASSPPIDREATADQRADRDGAGASPGCHWRSTTTRDALAAAYATSGAASPAEFRVAWIRNTLEVGELLVSEALAGDVAGHAGPRGRWKARSRSR